MLNLPLEPAVFSLKSDTDIDMVKLANNTYFQLGVFMSSTMIVQTIGLYQPTYALKFNNPLRQQLSSAKTSFDYIQPQQKPAFVPKTFNLLAFSFKSQ